MVRPLARSTAVTLSPPSNVTNASAPSELTRRSFACGSPRVMTRRSPPPFGQSSRRSRSEEHTSELQSRRDLVCRLLLEKKKNKNNVNKYNDTAKTIVRIPKRTNSGHHERCHAQIKHIFTTFSRHSRCPLPLAST